LRISKDWLNKEKNGGKNPRPIMHGSIGGRGKK